MKLDHNFLITEDLEPSSGSSSSAVIKVNSQVNMDEKTGRIVETPASNDYGLATNIDLSRDDKILDQKFIQMQSSSSLPDLKGTEGSSSSPASSGTISSNSNNQMPESGHGKLVILAVETQDEENLNQIDGAMGGDGDHSRKKIKLNIGITSNASSSSTSSNNLEYGMESVSNASTL